MSVEQDVAKRIIVLLTTNSVSKIDFTIDGVRVQGAAFGVVVGHLLANISGGKGIGIQIGGLDPKAAAQYDQVNNKFIFPRATFGQTSVREKAGIVHESVHAYLDARMPKVTSIGDAFWKMSLTTTAATDEAAAFVTGAMYYLYETTIDGKKPVIPASWKSTISGESLRIAEKIMNKPGAVVSADDVTALKKKIMDDPFYSDI